MPRRLARLTAHQLQYDRSTAGEFWHFYTPRIGRVCFELVQRIGAYDVYGGDNTPVLLAAQDRLDRGAGGSPLRQ
ncbi:hypothetical protein GCM10027059_14600 [Myceligenerans halotolerans]